MSRLKILDLSFCESEVSNSSRVQGGVLQTSVSTAFNAATSANFSATFAITDNRNVSVVVLGTAGGASASGIAAAFSDGAVSSSTLVRVTA